MPDPLSCIWFERGAAKAERIEDETEAHKKTLDRAGVLIDSHGTVVLDFVAQVDFESFQKGIDTASAQKYYA